MGLPLNYREDSQRPWSTTLADNRLRELIQRLRALEIEPTDAAAYDALMAAQVEVPPPPPRLLDAPTEELVGLAFSRGVYSVARDGAGTELRALQAEVRAELRTSMAAEVDDYLTALQPKFDRAAATVRRCAAIGITGHETGEQIMRRGAPVIAAWMAFRDDAEGAATLADIAGARILMSLALGVPPVNTDWSAGEPVEYAVCFTQPAGGALKADELWRNWLALAPVLHLNTLDELPKPAPVHAPALSSADLID